MEEIDCVVIGAGVVGLAVARALAIAGYATVIAEQETVFGSGISARNSEVIHAGLYYAENSRKARHCRTGRNLLYDYCRSRAIAFRRCGKLIVAATPDQLPALDAIRETAAKNGVDDLIWLDAGQLSLLEPGLVGCGALLSPSTGIIDSHGFMSSLLADALSHGAAIAYATTITRLVVEAKAAILWINQDPEPSVRARLVVNAAGLAAWAVARSMVGFPADHIPPAWYAKGSYFSLSGRAPFRHLVYPVPEPGGLGVHMTLDLGGRARFGPDVEWVEQLDFRVDPRRSDSFYAAIRTYWPDLKDGALAPDYAGIRPKLSGPSAAAVDFHIGGGRLHGVNSVINLFGIESPGLTAALAIAEEVAAMAREALEEA